MARRAVNARQTAGLTGWTWGNGIRGGTKKKRARTAIAVRASRLLNNADMNTYTHLALAAGPEMATKREK